jgi:membrane dipeptidase
MTNIQTAARPLDDFANRAAALHRAAIVIDGACPDMDDRKRWDKWISGGATVATPTIAITEDSGATVVAIGRWYRWLRTNAARLMHIQSVADIRRAKAEGKLGVLFHFQGTAPIGWKLDLVEVYHRLGVRMIQLCYNRRDLVGDGCTDRTDSGLSDFGVTVVQELNRVGVLIDLTHTSYKTSMEAAELSTAPVVVSHANSRVLCDSRRNIWDDQAKLIASKGGLVGITALPGFVSKSERPTLDQMLDHIDYFVQLIGIDHVAFGMDFYDGGTPDVWEELTRTGEWNAKDIPPCPHIFPENMEDASKLPNLTRALLTRGYAEDDVKKILGENWIRVFGQAWH